MPEEEEEVSNIPIGRWNDEDDVYEGLESRVTMAMLEELRMLTMSHLRRHGVSRRGCGRRTF